MLESELIKGCIKGDKKAQYVLYKELFNPLMQIAVRYCINKEDAISLVNDGFLKIILGLETYTSDKNFTAWARRIMINTSIDKYRAQKNYKENTLFYEQDAEFEQQVHQQNPVVSEVDVEQIHWCLNQLPRVEKDVFNLYSIDGYAHAEIAKLIGISERSSKRHLASARQSLQSMLKNVLNMALCLFLSIFKIVL